MRRIEIIDCENANHKIAMMISDDRMDFADDVYLAISRREGLSPRQAQKLESFKASCSGPIMVNGYYFDDNESNYIAYREFDWTRYDIYATDCNVFIEYSTRIHGDRGCVYKMSKDKYKGLDSALDEIDTMKPFWVGSRID